MENDQLPPPDSPVPDGVTFGFFTQLMIFAVSVLAWLLQMSRGTSHRTLPPPFHRLRP